MQRGLPASGARRLLRRRVRIKLLPSLRGWCPGQSSSNRRFPSWRLRAWMSTPSGRGQSHLSAG
eukprot:7551324-Alexandrium_andersonii.AAC.1